MTLMGIINKILIINFTIINVGATVHVGKLWAVVNFKVPNFLFIFFRNDEGGM